MLGAVVRIDLARHASKSFSRIGLLFVGFSKRRATIIEGWWQLKARRHPRRQNPEF
jgi:hypothetical protein